MNKNVYVGFGMRNDLHEYRGRVNFLGLEGHKQLAQKRQYVKHYLEGADNLYGVRSEFAGLPNFMVWSTDTTWMAQPCEPLNLDVVIGNTRRYVANMTEEELALFLPIFQQICTLYNVYRITLSKDTFELHTMINGQPKRLLVSVMNMIDFERNPDVMRHWWFRDTIN